MRPCRAASSSRTGSFVPRNPAVFTSRMSMAGSRERKPWMILASRSSSVRKRTVTCALSSLAAGCFEAGKKLWIRFAQRRYGSFELTLDFGEVLFDHLFVLQIVGNRAIHLRERHCWKRTDDLLW